MLETGLRLPCIFVFRLANSFVDTSKLQHFEPTMSAKMCSLYTSSYCKLLSIYKGNKIIDSHRQTSQHQVPGEIGIRNASF